MSETHYDHETISEVALLVKRSWPTRADESESYTQNQMIEAWQMGISEAFRVYSDTLKRVLEENIKYAASTRDALFEYISDRGLIANRAYLNVESYDTLGILLAVREVDFCSEAFLTVLAEAARNESQAQSESTLNLSIRFVPDSGDIDEEQLLSDGYIWPYSQTAA